MSYCVAWAAQEGLHWGMKWVPCFKVHMLGWYLALGQQAEYQRDVGVAQNAMPPSLVPPEFQEKCSWIRAIGFS